MTELIPSTPLPSSPEEGNSCGELMTCMKCGRRLPRSKLERMKTGTYRRVCNHCKWLYYVKPSRDRRILRDLKARHKH